MTIGELDSRVTIQEPRTEVNDYGELPVVEWLDFRQVWAKVEWKGGNEGNDSDKITATTFVNFYIRNLDLDDFVDGVDNPTMAYRIFFKWGGVTKYYYLQAIEQIEGRYNFLKIITKEKD